jgi:uridine kinase
MLDRRGYRPAVGPDPAPVHGSRSTWQQPLPAPASATRTSLLAQVARRVDACGSGRLRVAIDGRTAAGKTSFGHELAQQLARSGRPVLRATLDDFKRPWRDRHLYDRESG